MWETSPFSLLNDAVLSRSTHSAGSVPDRKFIGSELIFCFERGSFGIISALHSYTASATGSAVFLHLDL